MLNYLFSKGLLVVDGVSREPLSVDEFPAIREKYSEILTKILRIKYSDLN